MKFNLKIVAATAAVAMMSSGAAFAAASITVAAPGTFTYSKEGLALAGNAPVTLPNIILTVGNSLTYQDDILITLPGTVSVAAVPSAGLVTCTGAGNAVGYVTTVAGGWDFRVTDVSGVTIGTICTFSGLQVTAASLSNTAGQLTYQANRAFTTPVVIVDGPVSSATAILVKSQFALTTQQKLNGIVNVYTNRTSFFDAETVAPGNLGAPNNVRADTLNFSTFTSGNPVVALFTGPTAVVSGVSLTITGDFSWVDGADAGATCDPAEFTTSVLGYYPASVPPGVWAVGGTSNCQQLVLSQAAPYGDSVNLGYFFVPGTVLLSATDWVGSATWAYSLSTTPAVTGSTTQAWDPGAWTLNGAQVYIQYMPYGTGISRIVYAANRGVLTPDVTADVTANGATFSCALGTVPAKTVTNLSTVIDTCVAAKGIVTGKVAILLTFIAPDKDIEVYSAYNVGGTDRGTVVNTSNGRAFFYGTGVSFP
jgi:hypothetical protein